MLNLSKLVLAMLLLESCAISPHAGLAASSPPADKDDLAAVVEKFSDAVISRRFELLRVLMGSNNITFDQSGNIEPGIACFLHWMKNCPSQSNQIIDILKGKHFVYYYHLDSANVIASFIKEEARKSFYDDPSGFLENDYMTGYFSCQLVNHNGHWLLTESLCYSETEGPFEAEPDV